MPSPRKTHGKFQGKWYIPNHVINRYKERVDNPQKERRTKIGIERIITKALHGIDSESLDLLPMLDGAYVHEVYFNFLRGRRIGPYYLLLEKYSKHEPNKPAVVSILTKEMYRSNLGSAQLNQVI